MTTKNDNCIAAMPTEYKGVQLKSRFEAQCAYLFDCLGWKWKYEPTSYMLPNGVAYLPDFLIENRGFFVECRGYESDKGEAQIAGFSQLIAGGVAHEDWSSIHRFLVLRGDSEASFYYGDKHCGMVFVLHCKECGWNITSLSGDCGGMSVVQAYCTSCIAPMDLPEWNKWDGKTRIDAAAMVTVSKGKILVNGAGSDSWGWLSGFTEGHYTEGQ